MPDSDLQVRLCAQTRDFMSDLCSCINLSHTLYRAGSKEQVLLQHTSVTSIGDIRMLLAELLFEIVAMDLYSHHESLNCIHDSSFHILLIWAMQKCHNNIYLVKYTSFFTLFCSKASNLTLTNALIKTNAISDLAQFFVENIFKAGETSKYKDLFLSFFQSILSSIQKTGLREDCKPFFSELSKSLNWKYLLEVMK